MADLINGVITLGIGPDTTASIEHFVLFGLNAGTDVFVPHGNITFGFEPISFEPADTVQPFESVSLEIPTGLYEIAWMPHEEER